jgi:hypothetical protein
MNRRSIVRNLAALGLLSATGLGFFADLPEARGAGPSPRDIMDKVALTRKLDGSEAVVKMLIVSEQGQTRERKITMATKLYDGGKTEKRIYRFSCSTTRRKPTTCGSTSRRFARRAAS